MSETGDHVWDYDNTAESSGLVTKNMSHIEPQNLIPPSPRCTWSKGWAHDPSWAMWILSLDILQTGAVKDKPVLSVPVTELKYCKLRRACSEAYFMWRYCFEMIICHMETGRDKRESPVAFLLTHSSAHSLASNSTLLRYSSQQSPINEFQFCASYLKSNSGLSQAIQKQPKILEKILRGIRQTKITSRIMVPANETKIWKPLCNRNRRITESRLQKLASGFLFRNIG